MKRSNNLFVLFFLFSYYRATAQAPVIDSTDFFRSGRSYPYKYLVDTSLKSMRINLTGPGVHWDYSHINCSNYFCMDTTQSINPATTPQFISCGISGTDTANICLLNKSKNFSRTEEYRYLKTGSGMISQIGKDQDNGVFEDVHFTYGKPGLFSLQPMTYLSSATDSFRGTYFSYLSGMHTLKGYDTLIADGYGILEIDGKIYPDCIRLKHTAYVFDSNAIVGNQKTASETYTWYTKKKEGPVLIVERSLDINAAHPQPFVHAVSYYFTSGAATVIEKEPFRMSITIFPVPSKEYLTVRITEGIISTGIKVGIYNNAGQLMIEQMVRENDNRIQIGSLTPGVYSYRIFNHQEAGSTGQFIKN